MKRLQEKKEEKRNQTPRLLDKRKDKKKTMNSNFKDNAKLRFRDEYSFHELFINILTFQFFSKKNFPQYTKRTNLCQCHGTLIKVPWSMCTFSYNIFSYIKRI